MQVIMLVMMLSYANMCHRGVDAAVDVDHDGGIGNDGDAKLGYGVPTRGRWKPSFCWKLELDSKFQPGTVTA